MGRVGGDVCHFPRVAMVAATQTPLEEKRAAGR
jgi:hypothetical protein